MKNFTDTAALEMLDPQHTIQTTELLPKQIRTAWEQVKALPITKLEGSISNIVFCGMGASIYGALVLKSLFAESLTFPIEIISDYHIPAYVDEHTLVVLTSYSGTTEEVLSCAHEAKEKRAHMLVLTKGGPLAEFAQGNGIPAYIFDGALNLSSTPRLGAGYTIIGLLGLFVKLGLIDIDETELITAFSYLEEKQPELKQKAMEAVKVFENKIPIIFAAEHLSGNAQILRNQFNETSKAFSAFYLIPDLNHHLMEGLQFPKESPLHFIVLNSTNYSKKITARVALTIEVVKRNQQQVFEYVTSGATMYQDLLEILAYGSYLTLFLALTYDQNPSVNPWVDYFKSELKKEE